MSIMGFESKSVPHMISSRFCVFQKIFSKVNLLLNALMPIDTRCDE